MLRAMTKPHCRWHLVFALAALFATGQIAVAETNLAGTASDATADLSIAPTKIVLHGRRARQQLAVTQSADSHSLRDVTREVEFASSNPAVVIVKEGVAHPVGNGTAFIIAKIDGREARVATMVEATESAAPVSFKNETLAALTRAGCNMGACHGSPSGKGGFRLSLRAYDPPLDILTLRSEYFGRRANPMAPGESLLLRKPLMEVAHGGGKRLRKHDVACQVLYDWVAEGLRLDAAAEPDVVRIEVIPEQRVFQQAGDRQQLIVLGHFSDGSTRDVTALSCFSSSSETVAKVSEAGVVEKVARGETAILARYLDKMATSHIAFLEEVPGFAWNDPPENNFVDALVHAKLRQLQILPAELCTDEEFVRRAYLDTAGRLPTVEESRAFLADSYPRKRDRLVETLVDSADFATFWTLTTADILRANSRRLNSVGVRKFHLWLYESIYNDVPVDRFARELLTARGSVYENAAANYWRTRSKEARDGFTEDTAQVFLGIRIQCAKCHNHPFERWTQDNYYGIGALFARVVSKRGVQKDEDVIVVARTGESNQPRTGKIMPPHLLLKGDVEVPQDRDRREVFAEWLTAPDNPFFAKTAVNRIWGQLMGRGIVEPVDDFRDSNPPSNAPLLDALAQEFVKHGFSRKWVVRTIMQSRTYQLSSGTNAFNGSDESYFSHAKTRLLSAEQLLDAISTVAGVPETFPGAPAGARAVELAEPPADNNFLKVFGQPQREMACQCERSTDSNLSQALQLINGPVVHEKLRHPQGRIALLVAGGAPDEQIIEELYRAALARPPEPAELDAAKKHLAASADRKLALEDIGWALLNSKEFLFQH